MELAIIAPPAMLELSGLVDSAWAAGFFDGEGCVSCSPRVSGPPYPKVIIGQIHKEVLLKFQSIVGLGNLYSHQNKKGTVWQLQINGHDGCIHVMKMLWPYLGTVKKEQALNKIHNLAEHLEL